MMDLLQTFMTTFLATVRDVMPILLLLLFFQFVVLRRKLPNARRVAVGFIYVIAGLALFLIGLEQALFPLGEIMATQLTDPAFIHGDALVAGGEPPPVRWQDYYWVYIFAAAIGFSTTVAEPSLIAVAMKASEMSGGALSTWGLRIAVAIGVAASISLGAFRIVTGTPLHLYMIVGYLVVIVQTMFAPKMLVPLAYDSGGVTTSTVTVPLVAALGLGLASTVPGRSPLIDGFGLIALASLFPMITVMGYAQISQYRSKLRQRRQSTLDLDKDNPQQSTQSTHPDEKPDGEIKQ